MSTADITPIRPELAPHFAHEIAKDEARVAHFEASRRPGVRHGGMDLDRPVLRGARDHIAAAEASLARSKAFIASPQGRFYAACVNIGKAGAHPLEAHRALAAYGRGFSSTAEIECARQALSAVSGPDADEARQALAEVAGSALLLAAE